MDFLIGKILNEVHTNTLTHIHTNKINSLNYLFHMNTINVLDVGDFLDFHT